MKSACFSLQAGIAIPRRSKRRRILARNSSLRSSSAGSHAATAATVTSSAVGPRPPVVKTRARGARSVRRAPRPISAGSSPTIDLRTTGMPISSSRAESQSELVSWRSGPSISLPIAMIAADGRVGLDVTASRGTAFSASSERRAHSSTRPSSSALSADFFVASSCAATGPSVSASSQSRVSSVSISVSSAAIFSSSVRDPPLAASGLLVLRRLGLAGRARRGLRRGRRRVTAARRRSTGGASGTARRRGLGTLAPLGPGLGGLRVVAGMQPRPALPQVDARASRAGR